MLAGSGTATAGTSPERHSGTPGGQAVCGSEWLPSATSARKPSPSRNVLVLKKAFAAPLPATTSSSELPKKLVNVPTEVAVAVRVKLPVGLVPLAKVWPARLSH